MSDFFPDTGVRVRDSAHGKQPSGFVACNLSISDWRPSATISPAELPYVRSTKSRCFCWRNPGKLRSPSSRTHNSHFFTH
jgi:hypothetical protein